MKQVEVFRSEFNHHPITTICGSMTLYDDMIRVAEQLTSAGTIALVPFIHADGTLGHLQCQAMMEERITMSDSVCVVRKDGYIGANTKTNIEFAESIGVPVKYYDVKEYRDEEE